MLKPGLPGLDAMFPRSGDFVRGKPRVDRSPAGSGVPGTEARRSVPATDGAQRSIAASIASALEMPNSPGGSTAKCLTTPSSA